MKLKTLFPILEELVIVCGGKVKPEEIIKFADKIYNEIR